LHLLVNDLQIWAMAFDPSWDAIEHALHLTGVVADRDASDDRPMMVVLMVDLRGGDVEMAMQPGKERLEPAPLLLQPATSGEVELYGHGADVHREKSIRGSVRLQAGAYRGGSRL